MELHVEPCFMYPDFKLDLCASKYDRQRYLKDETFHNLAELFSELGQAAQTD